MPWEPKPEERDLYMEVFIDESSQNAFDYLVMGGIVVSMKYAAQFEEAIIKARGNDLPIVDECGKPRTIKWNKANYKTAAYKRVVDAFFAFPKTHSLHT